MAIEKYETPPEVSDAEIVAMYRYLLTRGAVAGVEYEYRNRRVVFPGVDQALRIIREFETRIADESGPAVNYARINRR